MLVLLDSYSVFLLHTETLCIQPGKAFTQDTALSRTNCHCWRYPGPNENVSGDWKLFLQPCCIWNSSFFSCFQHLCYPAQEREWTAVVPSPANLPNLFLKSPALPISAASHGGESLGLGERELLCFSSAWSLFVLGNREWDFPAHQQNPSFQPPPWPRFPQLNDARL